MSIALAFDSVTRNARSACSGIGAAEGNDFTGGLVSIDCRTVPIARGERRQHKTVQYHRRPSEHLDWNRRAKEQVPGRMWSEA
ncbi:MAG: hypothetical protein VX454_07645 [Pseudomonadota bacterium]|nr:hypothetical protein [Pseudomonadota bacterium]